MHHDPESVTAFHWPVAVGRVIAAPSNEVWNVISSPGMLPLYHPFCTQNPVHNWPGIAAHDEIHYFNGRVLDRHFTDWFEDSGYDLHIGRPGGRRSCVSWRIRELDERRTRIIITIFPHAVQHLPIVIRWVPHLMTIRPQLKRYLDSVVRGLDRFITIGEPVERNQFGPHPWFSPPVEGDGDGAS